MKTTLANLTFSFFLFFNPTYSSNIDSLKTVLDNQSSNISSTEIIKTQIALADAHLELKDSESGLSNLNDAYALAEKIQSKTLQIDILFKIGGVYNDIQDYPKTIQTLKKLSRDFQPLEKKMQIGINAKISNAYRRLGNFELAYEYQLENLYEAEKIKDSSLIARSLYQVGNIFFFQNNYDVAIDYYQKTLNICELTNNKHGVFNSYGAIGGAYNRQQISDKALKYNHLSLLLAKEMDYPLGLAYATHNLAISYSLVENHDSALHYYYQSLDLKNDLGDKWGTIATHRGIGDVYSSLKDYSEAFIHFNKAMELSKELNSKPRLVETYLSFAEYYRATHEYELSNDYLFKVLNLKDTLINESTLQKMSDAKTRFEIREKEEDLLRKDEELKNTYVYALSGISLLLLLFLWAVYSRYKAQKRHNLDLKLKNEQIEEQHSELALAYETQAMAAEQIAKQNQQLEFSNSELKRFAYIASHDLKEPLRTIGSYTSLLKRRYKNKFDEDADEFLDFITAGVDKMYNLLNDVLNYSKMDVPFTELETIDSESAVDEILESLQQIITDKKATIQVNTLPEVQMNRSHFVQIFQNLIVNALKFNHSDVPKITIGSKQEEGFVQFFVKDNGIGFDPEYQEKIFQMFQRLNRQNDFEGTGVGLAICKKIVEHYGGKIWADSIPGQGSTFYFSWPVNVEKSVEMV